MKQRIISAIVALALCIPIIIYGGLTFYIGVSIVGLIGFYEFIKAKEEKRNVPYLMKVLSMFSFLAVLLSGLDIFSYDMLQNIDVKVLSLFLLLIPVVFMNASKTYNIEDALYLLGGVLFLGLGFNSIISIRMSGLNYLWFLLLITIFSDTFAFITGILIGRHKMCPSVSPKKTWEGFFGGTFLGTFVGTIFYMTAFDYNENILFLVVMILILSVIGQIGDLLFSAIKRHFGIKDFGNIMPGHGGVLDRLDSFLLVVLAYNFLSFYI